MIPIPQRDDDFGPTPQVALVPSFRVIALASAVAAGVSACDGTGPILASGEGDIFGVAADEVGRYLVPDFPDSTYDVQVRWVRSRGLRSGPSRPRRQIPAPAPPSPGGD